MDDLQMALRIKAERKQYQAEEVIHNPDLHRQILETWRRDSPKMVARLQKQGILDDLAFVCQERMWRAAKDNRKAGLPVTDAREQAERDHLMLEPEDPEHDEPMSPLAELQASIGEAQALLRRLGT